jgi:hypothetical protein
MGAVEAPLYTLIRQSVGINVKYTVTHGSKFDVTTPTATAGALGTMFYVSILPDPARTATDPKAVLTKVDWLPDPRDSLKESKIRIEDGVRIGQLSVTNPTTLVVKSSKGRGRGRGRNR